MTAMSAPLASLPEAQSIQHLSFRVRQAGYALPIDLVREIIEYAEVTRVPMMPDYIHGVINLRGNVVPVLDLAARFGLTRTEPGNRTCIVITELHLEEASQRLGLVVDAVDAVHDIDPREVLPPPPFGAQIRADFIAGMAQQDQRFLIILNLLQVLSTQDLLNLAQARGGD
ncbi:MULTISPECIES: chemotaxis protein CheW [Pseudomonas]|uniref:Purine-binding chemotaxis protein CheW n=1 Tax=Pseudomonas mosselii TaxID=78327 RepID=A0A5R8YXK3_9PSED|nr:chemotaxis protein CheW [Pseudomonas mosselii]TLP58238.1 purine-binding chemotaxis protein CheW [Pseudomonas mosselii]